MYFERARLKYYQPPFAALQGARSWKSEAHSTCPTPTKGPCERRKALNDSAEGKGPMYLHDPRSRSYSTPPFAEPISTDPLADVSATTQNGIDTCANL